jgi:hypothetical protein
MGGATKWKKNRKGLDIEHIYGHGSQRGSMPGMTVLLLDLELRESLEMEVEEDWEEMARKELGCEKETSCMLQLQWDSC